LHLDEIVLTIKGKHQYLWRAVNPHGYTLDVLGTEPAQLVSR
jgi:putative transposase